MRVPRFPWLAVLGLMTLQLGTIPSFAPAAEVAFTRTEDVVYGRKWGMALTMDVFRPKEDQEVKQNGAGLILVVSGGFFSDKAAINKGFVQPFVNRGYTVFAVVHGSQPRFTIPEAIQDMQRAVRFIRTNAKQFKVDPDKLGIFGGSAGGHLSLMIGTAGAAGNPKAGDPVERASSRVQAVACFFPPTDFLNWGQPGKDVLGKNVLKGFKAPFDFLEFDGPSKSFLPVTDEAKLHKIGKEISPIYHVSADDPPSLIIHGDADKLVPIQQAEILIEKMKEAKVECELIVRKGAGHGWLTMPNDLVLFGNWFDRHLLKKE